MNKILGVIDEDGFPVIPEVTIINPLNNTAVKPRAIIDTGAIGLHIKTDIIELLNLERIDGTFTVHPIHGRQPIDIFEVAVDIQGIEFGVIPVKTMLNNFPFDLIIGCGFLKDRKMVYDGVNKTIEITF
jgi:predicted aspartyl protease